MAIDIGALFKTICNKTYSAPGLNTIFSSVIYMSIVISVIIILIIMVIYPCKKGTPGWVLGKLFIYMVLSIIFMLSLHKSMIKGNLKKSYDDKNMETFISKIGGDNRHIYRKEEINKSAGFKPEHKPEYKSEYKPEYKPEYKSEYKSEYKPEYKPEYKSEYKPEYSYDPEKKNSVEIMLNDMEQHVSYNGL